MSTMSRTFRKQYSILSTTRDKRKPHAPSIAWAVIVLCLLFPCTNLAGAESKPGQATDAPGAEKSISDTANVNGTSSPVLGRDLLLPSAPAVGPLRLGNPEMAAVQRDVKSFFETLQRAQTSSESPSDSLGEVMARNGGPLTEKQLAELESFRSELSMFLTAAGVYPGARGIDPLRLFVSHQQILNGTPEELYLLRETVLTEADWNVISARLASGELEALQPLAKHGPLSSDDRLALETFRQDLQELLKSLDDLPAATRREHGLLTIGELPGKIAELPTETLFLVRQKIGSVALAQARHGAQALRRMQGLTPEGRRELEVLRGELLEVFVPTATDAQASVQVAGRISQMQIEELAMAEATLAELPAWRHTLPALHAAARSPGVARELEALRLGDPAADQEIEAFRAEMKERLSNLPAGQELDADLVAEAARYFEEASAESFAIYREALAKAPETANSDFWMSLAVTTLGLDPVDLPRLGRMNISCDVFGINPCEDVSDTVNAIIVDPINRVIQLVEDGINLGVDAINTIEELFSSLNFDTLIGLILDAAMEVVKNSLAAIGGLIQTVDQVLGEAVSTIREFVDDVKSPFIELVNTAGDPAAESELLTQLDGFMFNRDPKDGPLGLVTCMEEILCVQEETVAFEVILPGETEPIIREEQLCRKGFFIPLIGEVGSDRSVFACMVIKSEVAFLKDLMPEDSLPGGKVADIALSSFVHKLDQLCYVNDWMAGNRRLLLDRVSTATRNARFDRLLGSCTLEGVTLDCPDLPEGESVASIVNGISTELTTLGVGIGGVQSSINSLTTNVDNGFSDVEDRLIALGSQVNTGNMTLTDQLEEFQVLDLQVAIEANLASTAMNDGLAAAVSLFVLPESAGGMLDIALDLVASIIERAEAVELPTNDARELLQIAQDAIANSEYKRGYLNLARAYGEVMRLSPTGP